MRPTDIRILELEARFSEAYLRTPLKFGSGVVEAVTSCMVRAKVENGRGEVGEGWGNILLSDLWAWPTPRVAHSARDAAMRRVSELFCERLAEGREAGHPVDLYLEAKPELFRVAAAVTEELGLPEPVPELAALVCGCPVDAALHDAFGQVNGLCTYEGYGPDCMAHDLSHYLGPEFKGRYIADYLRPDYAPELPIFHLVGGVDKLTESELTDADPQDGLPVSLDQWIARDGIFCFKVKLRGNDLDWDVARTQAVAEVAAEALANQGREEFYLSTDSNEMNESPETVVEYLEKLREASPLAYDHLLYLEQPTERDLTAHRFDLSEVAKRKPVLADEGVTDLEKFDLALELGWSGVALKVCKGHSSALLYVCKSEHLGRPYTVQDLTNPGLSLVHEAGFAARIRPLMGFEYNARQYLPHEQPEVQRKHPDLFTVREGLVRTGNLGTKGLGYEPG